MIVNASEKCTGLITRIRRTKKKDTNEVNIEKSVLDYFIVCQDFYNLILDHNFKSVINTQCCFAYSSNNFAKCVIDNFRM